MSMLEQIKAIVAKQLDREPSTLDENSDLAEAGYESLDVIETVFALEEAFKIDIPFNANAAEEMEMRTVGDIVILVEKALAKQKPA